MITATTTPLRARLDAALAAITDATRATTVVDTTSCCRSCAVAAVAETAGRNYLVACVPDSTWRGDHLECRGDHGRIYTDPELWFNFGRIGTARKAAKVFRAHGFTVNWDGSFDQCVEVELA